MSTFIRIFCQSTQTVTRREIAQFIEDGVYFDKPLFELSVEDLAIDAEDWKWLSVHYQEGKRPIQFARNVDDKSLREEIKEILDEWNPSNLPQDIINKLTASYQVIAADIDSVELTEDAWFMLDALEHHLARNLDGIIYDGNGFYDENLKLIHELRMP